MHPDSGRKHPMRWRATKDGKHELFQEGVKLAVVAEVPGKAGRWFCCTVGLTANLNTRDEASYSADGAKSEAMSWVRRHGTKAPRTKHRPCPSCDAHVAVADGERPVLGRCFGCGRRYTVWADETLHALCACGVAHDERGHPYTVGEARAYFDTHGDGMEEYHRHLFEFLLEKAESAP